MVSSARDSPWHCFIVALHSFFLKSVISAYHQLGRQFYQRVNSRGKWKDDARRGTAGRKNKMESIIRRVFSRSCYRRNRISAFSRFNVLAFSLLTLLGDRAPSRRVFFSRWRMRVPDRPKKLSVNVIDNLQFTCEEEPLATRQP